MDNKIQSFFPILTAMAVFSTIFYFLIKILPGIQAVEIDMQIDHPDHLRVYYSNSNKFREDAVSAPRLINEQRANVKVSLTGTFANVLRLDTGDRAGTAKIYRVKISSYFHAPLTLEPKEIVELFTAGPDVSMQIFNDHVQILSTGNDPYLIGISRLFPSMYWQSGLLALAFALLAIIAMKRPTRPGAGHRSLAMPPSAPNTPERLDALDGLRGLAAIMVITDHTCSWFRGLGASGVWIFFALSGFLLARPFIGNSQVVLSFTYMSGYFRRRFMRILPMYYAFIFVTYVMSGRFNLALLHGLFLEGDGHLWALPQEVLFYLLWPVVILLLVLPLRKYPKATMIGLLLVMAAWNRFVGIESIWLLGMDHIKLPLYFGVFLAGVFFSFLYSYCSAAASGSARFNSVASDLASPLGLAIIIFFVLFSTGHIIDKKAVYSQQYFSYYGFLAGLLIFSVLYAKGRILDKFLTLAPLRELGTVGLSLYLVHPMVKNLIDSFCSMNFDYKLKNFSLLLATLGCSYILARYTFRHIEQPGFSENFSKNSAIIHSQPGH